MPENKQEVEQTAQQAGQAAAEAVRSVLDMSRTATSQEVGAEREFEIGKDEAWFANVKRTYDEFQDISLTAARRSQTDFDGIRNVSLQALQNAVETANMIGKQAVAHRDIAIDREWNVDEVSTLVAKSGVQADSMVVLLARAIAAELEK
jgi:hypothetical protein